MKLSDTDFPREVRERMEQVLLPGDEVLWAARPIPGWDSRLHEIGGSSNAPFMLLFTLAWCSGVSVFLYVIGILLVKGEEALSLVGTIALFLLPFVVIAVGLIRIWCRAIFRGNTCCYAITHHFLLMDVKSKLQARPIKSDMILKTEIYAQGQGHLFLKSDKERDGMFFLPDVRTAAVILNRAAAGQHPFAATKRQQTESGIREMLSERDRVQLQQHLAEGENILWISPAPKGGFPWKSWCFVLLMLVYTGAMLHDYHHGITIAGFVWVVYIICLLILAVAGLILYSHYFSRRDYRILTNGSLGFFTPGHAPRLTPLSECGFKQIIIDSRGIGTLETETQCIDYPCHYPGLLPEFFYLCSK
ncbi:MAG: hypothetical protein IJE66_04565 [Akkermansia sp.]|nr:hypothetical protein [Akkermansia sp.]MBQ6942057.1 hypothetical protein [Akkermansia sp.]